MLLFEENATGAPVGIAPMRPQQGLDAHGEQSLVSNNRFGKTEKTMWNDEDLDVPTYIRRNLTLDR